MNASSPGTPGSSLPVRSIAPSLAFALVLMALPVLLPAAGGKMLSPYVYRELADAQQKMERDAYNDSLAALKILIDEAGHSAYEQAVIQQVLGYVQINRASYPAAIRAFERSLALQQLPEATEQQLRYNLGQLYLAQNQPDKAIAILETWFNKANKPSAQAYVLLAQALAEIKQYRKAIPLLQKANSLSDEPHPDWYESLLAMHYELHAYRSCVPLLKTMIRRFPQHTRYWQQLAGIYMALDDPDAALAALELAFRQGALESEQERLQLAQLYLSTGIPYKAARFIEQQIKTGSISATTQHRELLAYAWNSARERKQAIRSLEHTLNDDTRPELRLRLAQWYIEAERWRDATQVLNQINAGDSERTTAQARLLLGIAYFELGDKAAARKAFGLARQFVKTRKSAQQWLDFIDSLSANNT